MIPADFKRAEGALREIVNRLTRYLSAEDLTNIMELIDHTESGVAFELLCDQLYEYADEVELLISKVVYRDIQILGVYFGFTKDTWEPLASFVVES